MRTLTQILDDCEARFPEAINSPAGRNMIASLAFFEWNQEFTKDLRADNAYSVNLDRDSE